MGSAPSSPDRLRRSNFFDGPRPRSQEHERDIRDVAATVCECDLFAERELSAAEGTWEYALSASGRRVFLRHGTQDVAILDEVFRKRLYDPPPHVAEILEAAAEPLTVVDVGANIGLFGAFVADRLATGTIVAFEPDPFNLALLDRMVGASGEEPAWEIVRACAGTGQGSVAFHAGEFACSRIAEPGAAPPETTMTPVVDLFEHLEHANLLKIDIEGGEWALLADPRLRTSPVRAIALEYHQHLSPPGPPGRSAEGLLHRAGFSTATLHERPDGQGMLWAWRDD